MSKSPSLRRIQADIRELALDPSDRYHATPLENDMFEWHFTIRGSDGTDFEGGIYHGRILLPPEYPYKPPHIIMLTPTGRFEINTKICLSFSAFHPELWQPAWGVRLILEALISFLPTPADGAIGALNWSSKERKRLAKMSQTWVCPHCGTISNVLPPLKLPSLQQHLSNDSSSSTVEAVALTPPPRTSRFQKEIEELQRWQQASHALDKTSSGDHPHTPHSGAATTAILELADGEHATIDPSLLLSSSAAAPAAVKALSTGDPDQPQETAMSTSTTTTTTTTPVSPVVAVARTTGPIAAMRRSVTPPPASPTVPVTSPTMLRPATATAAIPPSPPPPPPLMVEASLPEANNNNDNNNNNNNNNNQAIMDNRNHNNNHHHHHHNNNNNKHVMLDPILQTVIVLLSIVCYLLLRKVQNIMEDLLALEE